MSTRATYEFKLDSPNDLSTPIGKMAFGIFAELEKRGFSGKNLHRTAQELARWTFFKSQSNERARFRFVCPLSIKQIVDAHVLRIEKKNR